MAPAIQAENLVKTFGDVRALDGVSLDVPEGTVLGLLGPNGAGKTTTVRVLTTLLRPDSGRAVVAGVDVLEHPDRVRSLIGLSGQYAAVDEYLTGFENLTMVGELYQMRTRDAKARALELLEWFNLTEAKDRTAKTYSGGMRRRLDLAAALVVRPPVMFLDEPTTGLDPRNRLALWEVIETLVEQGTTLLLTTQYLEEADRLAHDIAVVDHGRVIARGTADRLKAQIGGERIEVVGAHSDIGGGYLPERYKSTFFYLPMHYPGIQEFYESRWGRGPTSLEPDNQINEDEDNLLAYGEIRPTSEVCLASTAEPGLQFVSLRLMHDRALSAGVPFEERLSDSIGAGAYSMPSDLNDYYLALTKGDTDQAGSMEVAIRRKYAHVSFNNESSFGVYPNLPEPSGIRRVARL